MAYGQPSPARKIASQGAMWVILLATVGVAAVVNRTMSRGFELTQVVKFGKVQAALPKGWNLESEHVLIGRGPGLRVVASPTANDRDSLKTLRQIRITQEPAAQLLAGDEYLKEWLQVPGPYQSFRVAGQAGYLGLDEREIDLGSGVRVHRFSLCAVTVTPSGLAISVRLDGYDAPAPDDRRLLKQVCDGMQILDL